jgi:YHS domain-containing protein
VQDAHLFLNAKGIELRDYLDDRRPARLDAMHGVRINYESYYFADLESRGSFLADPVRYCGQVTDPVTKKRFLPREGSPRTRHGEVLFFFQSWAGLERFELRPESYALPGWSM